MITIGRKRCYGNNTSLRSLLFLPETAYIRESIHRTVNTGSIQWTQYTRDTFLHWTVYTRHSNTLSTAYTGQHILDTTYKYT